jgi:hypothetical protein
MTMAETTESATLADTAPATPPAQRHLGLRVVLIIAAIVEALDALSSVPILFGDMSQIPGSGIGGAIIKAHIASHPPLALGALVFAAIGRVRHAVIALGAVVSMTWLNYMPSVVLHGLRQRVFGAADRGADHRLSADGGVRHRARRAQPAARTCDSAGQHSHTVPCVRRDRVCDRRQPARILTLPSGLASRSAPADDRPSPAGPSR